MIQPTTAPTYTMHRVNCEAIGRPKLLAEITPDGISVWCRICKRSHIIPRMAIIEAWEQGESVLCENMNRPDDRNVI